ncbi:hypothetical protein [Diaphorobacter aerolatus]|uniref:DUF2917 domain-containing protein n=1 Tax=Diaphorobacter aerolatus TaxID=1288495 RepID=A0A7H0GFV3_9BURK|nr:hypothetical protein [Diaphorobacter aerolatus]QNP47169.1 hypothetical protein H9K75_12175 [Diaphorobacter aerolatus]
MDISSTRLVLSTDQPQLLCAADIQGLRCESGGVVIEWQESGVPTSQRLFEGDAPWLPGRLPAGTWVRIGALSLSGARRATVVVTAPPRATSIWSMARGWIPRPSRVAGDLSR